MSIVDTQSYTSPALVVAPMQVATCKSLAPVRVVFCASPSFHPLFWLITLVPGSSLWMVWFFADGEAMHGQEGFVRLTVVLWIALLEILGFMLVLPHKYEVMSDASVNIVTFVNTTWTFHNICAVYDHQSYCTPRRQVFRFACDYDNCILLKRKKGWDLLLSPKDPGGFVADMWNVLSMQDEESPPQRMQH